MSKKRKRGAGTKKADEGYTIQLKRDLLAEHIWRHVKNCEECWQLIVDTMLDVWCKETGREIADGEEVGEEFCLWFQRRDPDLVALDLAAVAAGFRKSWRDFNETRHLPRH